MKSINGIIIALALIIVSFISCTDTVEPPNDAELSSLSQIETIPGFGWFAERFDAYRPNQQILDSIKKYFTPSVHKFYIFAAPACSCDESQTSFPYGMKVIDSAGISGNNYELFVMETRSSNHPYSSLLNIRSLPAIYVVKNGSPIFSIVDSLKTRGWLLNNNVNPNESIEALFLEALKM